MDLHPASRKIFAQNFTNALLIIDDENAVTLQYFRIRRWRFNGVRRWEPSIRRRLDARRQHHVEGGTRSRSGLNFDRATVFFDNGQGNGKAESASSAWSLGGEKRIKNFTRDFWRNARTVVREGNPDVAVQGRNGNAQGAAATAAAGGN